MRLQYTPVTVVYENTVLNATCTFMQQKSIFLTVKIPERYVFIFDNWEGEGPGLLIICKNGNGWTVDETSPIKDQGLAEAAGKCVETLDEIFPPL